MTPTRLDGLWAGAWPYEHHEGVGLHLVGVPSSPEAFIRAMAQHGCHPFAGKRIVDRLTKNGEDRLTVQYTLNFHAIHNLMADAGVQMAVIAPQPNWHQRFNDGPWPREYLPERMR